jgi:hypothetical protein
MSDEQEKEKATIAVANSILGRITLTDVLQLVQGNVLAQAKQHVDEMDDAQFGDLISSIEEEGQEQEEQEEQEEAEASS